MRQIIVNISIGSLIIPPSDITISQSGTKTYNNTMYYAIAPVTISDNCIPQAVGTGLIGTIMSVSGTGHPTFFWTPENIYAYMIYKGTSENDLYYYATVNGTIGSWSETNCNAYNSTGTPVDFALSYTKAIVLPQAKSYNAAYDNETVRHRLLNSNMVSYEKNFIFKSEIEYEQISDNELQDIQTIYNWRSDLKFFPNDKKNISFDCIITGGFNFSLTIPFFVNGGWSGNISLIGNKGITSLTDII